MASQDGLVELYPNTTSKSSDEPSQGGHLFLYSSAWNQAAAGLGLGPDMFIKPLVSGMLPGSVYDFIQKLGNWLATTVPARLTGFLTGYGDEHRPIAIIWMIIDIVLMILQMMYDITVMAVRLKQQIIDILLKLRRAAILMRAAAKQAYLRAEAEARLAGDAPSPGFPGGKPPGAPKGGFPDGEGPSLGADARGAATAAQAQSQDPLAARARGALQNAAEAALAAKALGSARSLGDLAASARQSSSAARAVAAAAQSKAVSPALKRQLHAASQGSREAASQAEGLAVSLQQAADALGKEADAAVLQARHAAGALAGGRPLGGDPEDLLRALAGQEGGGGEAGEGDRGRSGPLDGAQGDVGGSAGGVDGAASGEGRPVESKADPWASLVGAGVLAGDTREVRRDAGLVSGSRADGWREDDVLLLLQGGGVAASAGLAGGGDRHDGSGESAPALVRVDGRDARGSAASASLSLLEQQASARPVLLDAVLRLRSAAQHMQEAHDRVVVHHGLQVPSAEYEAQVVDQRGDGEYLSSIGGRSGWRRSRGMARGSPWTPWRRQRRENPASQGLRAREGDKSVPAPGVGQAALPSESLLQSAAGASKPFLFPKMEDLEEYGAMGAMQRAMVDSMVHTLTASVGADVTAKASRALHAGVVEHTGREVAARLGEAVAASGAAGVAPAAEAAVLFGGASGLLRSATPAVVQRASRVLLDRLAARLSGAVARSTSETLFGSERMAEMTGADTSGGAGGPESTAGRLARSFLARVMGSAASDEWSESGGLGMVAQGLPHSVLTSPSTRCAGCLASSWMRGEARHWSGPRAVSADAQQDARDVVGPDGGKQEGEGSRGDRKALNLLGTAECRRVCAAASNSTSPGLERAVLAGMLSGDSSWASAGQEGAALRREVLQRAMAAMTTADGRMPPASGPRVGPDAVALLWAHAAIEGSNTRTIPTEVSWGSESAAGG